MLAISQSPIPMEVTTMLLSARTYVLRYFPLAANEILTCLRRSMTHFWTSTALQVNMKASVTLV